MHRRRWRKRSGEICDRIAGPGVLIKHRGILTLCLAGGGSCFCVVCSTPVFKKTNFPYQRFVVFRARNANPRLGAQFPSGGSGAVGFFDEREGRDSGKHGDIVFGECEKCTPSDAVGGGDVVAVVRKGFARQEGGKFSDDPLSLDDNTSVLSVGDNPLAALERNGFVRVVLDGDKVDEGIGAVGGGV